MFLLTRLVWASLSAVILALAMAVVPAVVLAADVAPDTVDATLAATGSDLCAQVGDNAGFPRDLLVTAVAVGLAESGCNPLATNVVSAQGKPWDGSKDRGLWQINYFHSEVSDACAYDAQCNANAAYRISNGGTDWSQWVTYNSGAYRAYLDEAQAAVDRLTVPAPVDSRGGTAVSPAFGQVNFYYRDGDDHLAGAVYISGSGWQPKQDWGSPSGGLSWDPDATSWGSGHVDLVARNANGRLAVKSYEPGRGLSGWTVFSDTVLYSSPTAVSTLVGHLDVFWLGPNHTLQNKHWQSGAGWTGVRTVPGVTNADSGPDAASWQVGSGHLDMVYRGTDNQLWVIAYDGGWRTPNRVGAPATLADRDPAAVAKAPGQLTVYATTTSGSVVQRSYDRTSGWTWTTVPGSRLSSAPDGSAWSADHVDLMGGYNADMRAASWETGSGWSTWHPIP